MNPHKCGSSRRHLRICSIRKRYDNPWGFLRSFKEFSTIMRSSKEFLRVRKILQGPRAIINVVVSNRNLKLDQFSKPIHYHQSQTDKMHQFSLYFRTNMHIFSLFILLGVVSGSVELRISPGKLKNLMKSKNPMQNQHYKLT